MNKPRVIFPFVEAGMGHIMPQKSILSAFEKKYGDKVECVRSDFFNENGDPLLKRFGWHMAREVEKENLSKLYGFFTTFSLLFWGTQLSTWGVMRAYVPGSYRKGVEHMEELKPDLVVSTHWSTNYYAERMPNKPLTVRYIPDIYINKLDNYPCDLTLVSNEVGYKHGLTVFNYRYNESNLKKVPFCIREEAFSADPDKRRARKKLGVNDDEFVVVSIEGGYGIGKTPAICKEAFKRNMPVTIFALCGKNEKARMKIEKMIEKNKDKQTKVIVKGFIDNVFDYFAAADIMCGKSGASTTAEPCFFGLPMIITKHASHIERNNANYYVEFLKCAFNIFNTEKICDKIEELKNNPAEMNRLRENALKNHDNYGAEKAADAIFELLCTRFPELKETSAVKSEAIKKAEESAKEIESGEQKLAEAR